MNDFSRTELLDIIDSALDRLFVKHPSEHSTISVIRKAAEQLAATDAPRVFKVKVPKKQAEAPAAASTVKLGDLLAPALERVLLTEIKQKASVDTLLPYMRLAVPSLPKEDHPAKVAIARALGTHSGQFESFPGEKARDPKRYYVKR